MKKFYFPFVIFLLHTCLVFGQPDRTDPYIFDYLNNEDDRAFFLGAKDRFSSYALNGPPTSPVRPMAEWEEQQAVILTWASEFHILAELTRQLKNDVEVIIVCENANVVRNVLNNLDIDVSENVRLVEDDFDSIWVRDYGPNSAYINDVDTLIMVDWIYNRPFRVRDDVVSERIAQELEVPLYTTSNEPYRFVGTGGNYMSDGMGQSFSSTLIVDENSMLGIDGVDEILRSFMGVESYVKFDILPFDLIHHIDMHMKILDEQTILVGQYPEGIADGPQIEANIQFLLSNFTTSFGTPYKIERMPMPPDNNGLYPHQGADYRTYVNAYIGNKTIVVPTYEEQYDVPALARWGELMPGYNIQGINCNTIIPRFGALHCITKEVGVKDPLRIVHQQPECLNLDLTYNIEALFQHQSGIAEASVFIKQLDGQFLEHSMLELAEDDMWGIELSSIASTSIDSIEYYFKATANSGKEMLRPMVAPGGVYEVANCNPVSTSTIQNIDTKLMNAFPNPASSITCIPVSSSRQTNGKISLIDVLGREVVDIYEGPFYKGEKKYFFDALPLKEGVYLLQLQIGNQIQTQKIFVGK